MVKNYGETIVITEVKEAVPLVATIEQMRREINSNCAWLSQKARKLSMTNRQVALRLKTWELKLNHIREHSLVTHSLDELNDLKNRCEEVSGQLSFYSKK